MIKILVSFGHIDNFCASECNAIFRTYCLAIARKNCNLVTWCVSKICRQKIASIFRVLIFFAIFQKLLHCQRKTCYTLKFLCATAVVNGLKADIDNSYSLFSEEVIFIIFRVSSRVNAFLASLRLSSLY